MKRKWAQESSSWKKGDANQGLGFSMDHLSGTSQNIEIWRKFHWYFEPYVNYFHNSMEKTIAGKGLEMVAHDSSSSNFFVKLGKKYLI